MEFPTFLSKQSKPGIRGLIILSDLAQIYLSNLCTSHPSGAYSF